MSYTFAKNNLNKIEKYKEAPKNVHEPIRHDEIVHQKCD